MGTTKEEKKTLTRDEFYQFVVDEVPKFLDDEVTEAEGFGLNLKECVRANGSYQGLSLKKPAMVAAPVANLDMFYDEYMDNGCLQEILEKVADILVIETPEELDGAAGLKTIFDDYNVAKTKMFLTAYNREDCATDLFFVPDNVEDIVLVPRILVKEDSTGIMSCKVDKAMLSIWSDVTEEQLFEDAKANTVELKGVKIMPITEAIGMPADPDMPVVYIVTNDSKSMGAGVLFCGDTMKSVAEKIGGDFYALPSSISEWICMPASMGRDEKSLAMMVREVNRTQVAREDFLSNKVFKYIADEDKFFECEV